MFAESVTVHNHAASGRSSKSFIQEGRLKPVIDQMEKGDYLFIQFGHNDAKSEDPTRYTEPNTTYKAYLRQYIEAARQKEATPVLITPVERRRFDGTTGQAVPTHDLYPQAMKALGAEMKVPVIDLTTMSLELFQSLGVEQTKALFLWLKPGEHPNYPEGIEDNTHFQEYGAKAIAKLVIAGLLQTDLPLKEHVRQENGL